MSTDHPELQRALEDLSCRLERVERRLGLAPHPGPAAPAESPLNAAPPLGASPAASSRPIEFNDLVRRRDALRAATTDGAHPPAPPIASSHANVPAPPLDAGPAPHEAVVVAQPVAVQRRHADLITDAAPAVPPRGVAKPNASLEWLLGGKLFAIGAALLLIIGAGMGFKYGLDKGWFRVSAEMRCIVAAIVGAALIGGGEWVRRAFGKAGEIAAAAAGAAGLAIIYGAAYASYGLYHLVPVGVAFALLAVVSAGGIALGLLTRSLPMAVLALVGAYLNPILMGESNAHPAIGPAYVTAVLVAGLALAGWRPDPFRWLRAIARCGVVLVGSAMVASIAGEHPLLAIGFVAAWWALVHAELVFGPGRLAESAPVPQGAKSFNLRITLPVLASLGFTLWGVGVAEIVLATTGAPVGLEPWMITAGWTAATLALALVLAGNLRILRDPPETDRERLGVVLFGQAAALLIATVALGLSDWTETLAWLAMGVGVVAAGRWMRSALLDGYGLVLLAIAAGRLIMWDSWNTPPGGTIAAGIPLDRWTALMIGGGAAWLASARLLQRTTATTEEGLPSVGGGGESRARAAWVNIALAVGLTLITGCVIRRSTESPALVLAPAALCVAAAWAGYARRAIGVGVYGCASLALGAIIWAGRYVEPGWSSSSASPMLHPGLWVALAVVALGIVGALAFLRPADWRDRSLPVALVLLWASGALALAATSLEIARSASVAFSDRMVQGAAVSFWWGILGVAMVVGGFFAARPSVRWAGLALVAAAAVKAVFLDLADVSQGWRIVSFLALGLLMLGVAVGYARVTARLERKAEGASPSGP